MTIIYCIITLLVVYYLALWGWYRHADNKTENSAGNETLPEKELSGYTLIGASRYKGGQINPQPDKAGHLPQAAENDTIFAPDAAFLRRMPPEQTKRPAMWTMNRTTRTRKSPDTWLGMMRVVLRA